MTADEIRKMLRDHEGWLRDDPHGIRANLRGADLRNAKLRSVNLSSVSLVNANLEGADLHAANLHAADFTGANLTLAKLDGAGLYHANLNAAYLDTIKSDFSTLFYSVGEKTLQLYDCLMRGTIDGSSYKVLGLESVPSASSIVESWSMGIFVGHSPSNSQIAEILRGWIEEWLVQNGITFPRYRIVSSDECAHAF